MRQLKCTDITGDAWLGDALIRFDDQGVALGIVEDDNCLPLRDQDYSIAGTCPDRFSIVTTETPAPQPQETNDTPAPPAGVKRGRPKKAAVNPEGDGS